MGNLMKKQRGLALLEYCAGAAVIVAVIWGAMNTMGGSISDLFGRIGNWAEGQLPGDGGSGS